MKRQIISSLFLLIFAVAAVAADKDAYRQVTPEFLRYDPTDKVVRIGPGDVLNVRFYYNPELNKRVKVLEDGTVSLDLFQSVLVRGLTPADLQKKLVEMYSKEFKQPSITVDIETRANDSVFVTGEVLMPGAKEIRGAMTAADVLAMSQISQKNAGVKSVFLIRGTEQGKYDVYQLDASLPSGQAQMVRVVAGDILFVPRKKIVKVSDFIDQYVRQILPATPTAAATVLFTPGATAITSATAVGH